MAPTIPSDDDCSSDSDDDTPVANLPNRRRNRAPVKYDEESDDNASDEEAEFEDEEEGDSAQAEEDEDDDNFEDGESDQDGDFDSESEDDVPLSSLKSMPTTRKKTAKTAKPKVKTVKKRQSKKSPAKKKPAKKKSKKQNMSESSVNTIVTPSSELYSKCVKGKIIQSLLCRWWYAIAWPDPAVIPQSPPANCDALDGFPGVYVHTSGEEVGKIVDYRDQSTCPNFKNMAKKDSGELKELLLKAIDVQREQLIKSEGEGTTTQKDLIQMERWVRKVNVGKADKEANTVFKAAGFRI